MLRKSIIILLFIITIISLVSCSKKNKDEMSNFLVVSAFKPYSIVVNQIAEKTCSTDELFSNAKDLESKKLSSSQMKKINKARLVILNGNLEEKYAEQLAPYKDKIIYASVSCNQIRVELNKQYPYYWLDPDLMVDIAKAITAGLSKINVNYTATYEDRLNQLLLSYEEYLPGLAKSRVSSSLKFSDDLFFLKNYLTFHRILDNKSKIKLNSSISSDKDANISFDLWANHKYLNILDYYQKNFQLIIK